MEIDVVDRDDPTKRWADAKTHSSSDPIYSGEKNGDMIRWKIGDQNTLSGNTFTWKAEGPETINGPSGVGEFKWSIADGDDDSSKDSVAWKPGKYTISCTIQTAGGHSSTIELEQEVGARTTDLVAIGWINKKEVPLSDTGVSDDVVFTYPVNGNVPFFRRAFTKLHLGLISEGSLARPTVNIKMTSADRLYILNWMFKHGSNPQPPDSFDDEKSLESFRNEKTKYKLYNRFQIKYLLNEEGTEFKNNPVILKEGTSAGSTLDPISKSDVFESTLGDYEGVITIKDNNVQSQTNDASPEDIAVRAFNTLRIRQKWNHIGSSICFGVSFGLRYDFLHQKYPTYNLYERQEDGGFKLMESIKQAPQPIDNFNTNPYDPPLFGPAPFIIEK